MSGEGIEEVTDPVRPVPINRQWFCGDAGGWHVRDVHVGWASQSAD